ncbi:hypothetical protein JX265_006528 [Neoarthrinium moseri]|uniref:HIT-type domain-containing protein n=1 Tax=Neoarthrinium moseri TaxID=1658444 RepID=A0A9P9WLW1_9PEZI|nr:uncharacterized protein JN550_003100 [Neoarthrinium moseri]KAI1855329.1 hypothetical protein JX266_000194 [Neoarthrinium moseri]KAI1869438.1 hypothetical protein JX265_006528 [Neoarthrinium moseri]KAI1873831.1 hypothetical protein JN550_003100 [Neoarthrinium moseri]
MVTTTAADRLCVACEAVEGKYKCPRCLKYTCSLACSKSHREGHPAEEEKPVAPAAEPLLAAAPSSGAAEQQRPQDGAEEPDEFNKLFQKYPNLSSQLLAIAGETDPPATMTPGSESGEKFGFRRKNPKPWTKEIGIQNALNALRKARDEDFSGGIQEFCELVKITNARKEQENADDVFRRLAAQRDAQEIGQLIRTEKERD